MLGEKGWIEHESGTKYSKRRVENQNAIVITRTKRQREQQRQKMKRNPAEKNEGIIIKYKAYK